MADTASVWSLSAALLVRSKEWCVGGGALQCASWLVREG